MVLKCLDHNLFHFVFIFLDVIDSPIKKCAGVSSKKSLGSQDIRVDNSDKPQFDIKLSRILHRLENRY